MYLSSVGRLLTVTLIAAVLCLPISTVAQDLFGNLLDDRVVGIDVWVVDKKGDPVSGLSPNDFVLLEDGQPIEQLRISNLQSPLAYMAAQTGGTAAFNTTNYEAELDQIFSELGTQYAVEIKPGPGAPEHVQTLQVALLPGQQTLALAVVDDGGDSVSFVKQQLEIGSH